LLILRPNPGCYSFLSVAFESFDNKHCTVPVADLENFGGRGVQKFKRHEDTTQNTDVGIIIYLCFKLGVETPLILDSHVSKALVLLGHVNRVFVDKN